MRGALARWRRLQHDRAVAAIDGLLSLLVAQGADVLTLVEGRVPELTKKGEVKALSMPPLVPELLGRFAEEVRAAGDEASYVLDGKAGRAVFAVEIEESGRLVFRRADAAAEPAAPPPREPAPAAGAAPKRLEAEESGSDDRPINHALYYYPAGFAFRLQVAPWQRSFVGSLDGESELPRS